jgi:acetyltransferase-like isoleucine patch superfamily enzyme
MSKIIYLFLHCRQILSDILLTLVTELSGQTGIDARNLYYRKKGAQLAKGVRLNQGVILSRPENCILEENAVLYSDTIVSVESGGLFQMGRNSHFGAGCYILVGKGVIKIGEGVAIGPHTVLVAQSNVVVPDKAIIESRIIGQVVIGNDVFLGASVTVLPGSVIESHSVCGAGALVRGRVQSNEIVAGVPARKIGERCTSC